MSASLVGSEMCIRDSGESDNQKSVWVAMRSLQRHGSPDCWPRGGWAAPVSYTHLTLPTICSV
eukprot:10721280-Alexandrium_andersonii.AAC.1